MSRVLLLYGGRSAEHEVSCTSAVAVREALIGAGHQVIAVGIAKRDHMAISWFTERFPPRVRKAVDILGLALLAILNLVIFWYSLRWIDITGARMISVLHVPRWTAQIAIPIGTGVSASFCVIKLWLGLKGDEELGVPWMRDD